jgi:hypothetical protein
MGETNSPSVAHVDYDISPLSRVKFNSIPHLHNWRKMEVCLINFNRVRMMRGV